MDPMAMPKSEPCPHPNFCASRTAGCTGQCQGTCDSRATAVTYERAEPAPRKLNRAERRARDRGRGSGVSLRDARNRAKTRR